MTNNSKDRLISEVWFLNHAVENGLVSQKPALERKRAQLKAIQDEDNRILDELYRREADAHKAALTRPVFRNALHEALARKIPVTRAIDTYPSNNGCGEYLHET